MEARSGASRPDRKRTALVAASVIVLALAEVVFDAVTWIQLDVAAIYGLPLVLAVSTRDRRLLWTLTAGLIVATFAVYAAQIPPGAFSLTETFFVNRLFDAVAVLLTAGLLHVWMRSLSTVESQARLLEERNAELVRHEEQIARQNAELDRRRSEAEEASARKTQLLAAASHDIRTPVNAIGLMAEVIRRTAEDPGTAKQVPQLTARLQANTQYLLALLSALLDSARFESGQMEYEESVFSLNALLVSTCGDFLPAAQTKQLRLTLTVPEEALWIRSDRIKLHRVISNLLANAVKFTEAGGITVAAQCAGEHGVRVLVRDTGIGMDSRELARIFEDFAQLTPKDQAASGGWGLGLAICRRLVSLLGGSISVESEPNRGSLFSVHLPARCRVRPPDLPLQAAAEGYSAHGARNGTRAGALASPAGTESNAP
jgi:signal transduction histidine kinase